MTELINKQGFSVGQADSPATPYQKAAAAWDERIGNARIQAKNWRIMALILAGLLGLTVIMLVNISSKSSVQPYIIKVGNRGDVMSVAPLHSGAILPDEAMVRFFLTEILQKMRTLPLDPVVAKQNWLGVYNFLSQETQVKMNTIAQTSDPFADLGERTRSINIESLVSLSETTKQFRWTESTFATTGSYISTENYTGAFTYAVEPPTTAERLQVNPLGLMITNFDITRDAE